MENFLVDGLLNLQSYRDLLDDIENRVDTIGVNGVIEEALGHFLYSLSYHNVGRKFLITYDDNRAQKIYEDLKNLQYENVYLFPKKDDFFYVSLGRSLDNSHAQLRAMDGIKKADSIIITTVEGIQNKIMDKKTFQDMTRSISIEDEIDLDEISQYLVNAGYENVSQVEGKGQFSIRGGIIDIFSPIWDNPVRLELFDTEIDSIRYFDILSQRSIENIEEFSIVPASELLINESDRQDIISKLENELQNTKIKDQFVLDRLNEKYGLLNEKLKEKMSINNLDLLTSFMNPDYLASILDYIDNETLVFIDEPKRIENYIQERKIEFKSRFSELLMDGEVLPIQEDSFYEYDELVDKIKNNRKITFSNILRDNKHFKPESIFTLNMKSSTSYNGRMDIFKEEVERLLYKGYKILILAQGEDRLKRLEKSLEKLKIKSEIHYNTQGQVKSSQVILLDSPMISGFEYTDIKFVIINHREIYGSGKKQRKRRGKKENKESLDFSTIKVGDYIVHENHGLGIYQGTEQVEISGIKKDYLLIKYSGADRLYVPTDQLGMLHKYSSDQGARPKIHRLNSVEWAKTKAKAQKSIDDMADELIELYAKREAQVGHQFGKDTVWQNQFEDAFPHRETEGQLESIKEIKADMERPRPMDRLLCADVGYGKTEVALRAAFKAVMDGKQVAILVPTTILAQQHYNTMQDRFRNFPINIAVLSRFRTKKETDEDIKRIKKGLVDIVVGTHRILSQDVKFPNLGLLIIDEEQRFGVRHKESLKMLKENVDTLTLTATPIPRTLQMSMIGIRDMSVIDEPPEERFPIQTYVAEFNPSMIREAILREIDRGGQVYFLYNKVKDIENMAAKIQDLVPNIKVGIAHGQMTELQLENTFIKFLDKEIDVLVCTTIIETGLDISNVNTIIIYDADKFGLSQLYQLRGRVGRSNKIAYAYFTYKADTQLSEIAEKRLIAIKEFTEFGSGFKIAMRDLEIRGAGNILGAQQSGHINAIGYDMYFSLLENQIRKLKGEKVVELNETTVDINVEAFIPNKYIEDDALRLEFYKKIATIESEEDYSDLVEEFIDRFGDMPESVSNLLDISYIKFIGNAKNIEVIRGDKNELNFSLFPDRKLELSSVNNLMSEYGYKINVDLKNNKFTYKPGKYILEEIKDLIALL